MALGATPSASLAALPLRSSKNPTLLADTQPYRARIRQGGNYGDPGFPPPGIYLQPLCSRASIILRVGNDQTRGRDRMAYKIEEMADDAFRRHPVALLRCVELAARARAPLPPELVGLLLALI